VRSEIAGESINGVEALDTTVDPPLLRKKQRSARTTNRVDSTDVGLVGSQGHRTSQPVRRSVSVDLTVPVMPGRMLQLGPDGHSLVPLATLAKRPLRNFSLRDEQ
jgi:hypothetical protein